MTLRKLVACFGLLFASVAAADVVAPPTPPVSSSGDVEIRDVSIRGAIQGENILFTMEFTAECAKPDQWISFVSGDVALDKVLMPSEGCLVSYRPDSRCYVMSWPGRGTYKTSLTFAARPKTVEEGAWRESEFLLPAARLREIQVVCDRTDLEVRFPGALRATREVKDGALTVGAILGPGLPFVVRWKPQVAEMDAALVLAGEANTVATIRAGALKLDSLYVFDISQGKLRELAFDLPASEKFSITQVRGAYIRDWRIEKNDAARKLIVSLNRAVAKSYAVQVVAEMTLSALPAPVELPVLKPEGLLRAGGHLAVGTDSAVQMVVEQTSGLSQTEPSGFPRLLLDKEHDRPLPSAKAFYYSFASTPYKMTLQLSDIVPSYDASGWSVIQVREEELSIDTGFDLDVRDAPLRDVTIAAPSAFTVAAVTGEEVQDYTVAASADKESQDVIVHFKKPVLGRTLVNMRLELGRRALDTKRAIGGIFVRGAKSERGFVAVGAEASVQLEAPVTNAGLREVHTASIPVRVANAQFAYRYREPGWSLEIAAARKPSGIMAESFHLISLGDGALYGYVVVNYFISGAPVDEFKFRVPAGIENVEFVGNDLQRWSRDGDIWSVKLQRKVIGDYNLAVSYSHPWKTGGSVVVGGVECEEVARNSGFICVSSRLNLLVETSGAPDASLLEVKNEEVPANYRLLLNAPVLKSYKYVARPHNLPLKVSAYEHGAVLPVAIELMETNTQLNITDAGATESVTTIRYKIKNASNQFLSLNLPKGVTVWSTRLIENGPGGETSTRLTTSLDDKGVLMIPLKRLRDPNQPMTIELVYGQEHPELKYGGRLNLSAPTGPVQTAYASWSVIVPENWAASPAGGGTMVPGDRRAEDNTSLGDTLRAVAKSWRWAVTDGLPAGCAWYMGAGVLLLLISALFLRGAWVGRAASALLLLSLLWIGIRAVGAPEFGNLVAKKDLRAVTFTRALVMGDSPAMSISAHVVPAWRRSATLMNAVIAPAFGLALIFLGLFRYRRARQVLAAAGVVVLLSGAARFAPGAAVLAHVFTWGLPVACLLWLGARLRLPVRAQAVAATTAALAMVAMLQGCAAFAAPLPKAATINQAVYELTAERDSMNVKVTLHVSTPVPTTIPVVPFGAILLSEEKLGPNLTMVRQDGCYALDISKAGRYDVAVEFLHALPEAGENQVRGYRMALPLALASQVTLRIPEKGIEILAPTAVAFTREQVEETTVGRALLGPGDAIEFVWKPAAREREKEQTAFYADVVSLVRFDTGLARGRHRVRFQIAQGELKEIHIQAPANVTITAVEGANLGAWRFNPETRDMEARLTQPAAGEYVLTVTTQTAVNSPAVALSPLRIRNASNQRDVLGLTSSPAVQVTPAQHVAAMNVDDFAREAQALMAGDPALKGAAIRSAYRIQSADDILSVEIAAVRPEIRSQENATFTVSDERLVYNGELRVSVAKAGVFSLDLTIPEGYDIDALAAPEVSHWDETSAASGRIVQVHFRNKLLGDLVLKATLSRPIADLPEQIVAPRIEVRDSLKHNGQLTINASRNVRLSVKQRAGVSELSALDLGIRIPGALAFNLLRPDWQIVLASEAVRPRVNVDFLHVAEVSDGLVRHTHYLRYRFYNAGQKILEVQAPKGAMGLEISGSEIAHLKEIDPANGIWRVELARQQFEEPYLLKLRFETQFDRAKGDVTIEPSQALGVDLQRGTVVAYSTDRMELAEKSVDKSVQPADARNVSRTFGAGDLSGAAFCYSCPGVPYTLAYRATRHQAAALLEATVLETTLDTVLSETGATITHAHLKLRVGSKRHLEVRLPRGAQVWSLNVNLSSEVPSKRAATAGDETLLIPLAQAVAGDLPAEVDLLYIAPPAPGAAGARELLAGPQFDLPLQKVRWKLYLPERYRYSDFVSTLNVDEDTMKNVVTTSYDMGSYERQIEFFNARNLDIARELQAQGAQLAKSGKQQAAKQALTMANNYAFNDQSLNEDTRVQLNNLMRQQAVVGLVNRRGDIRQKTGEVAVQQDKPMGTEFDLAQAERVRNSLNRDDDQNLETIVKRLVEMQEEVSRAPVQLMLNAPLRGRVIELTRELQVKPDAEMSVSFDARPELPAPVKRTWIWGAGLAVLLALVLLVDRRLVARRAAPAPEATLAP